MKNALKVLTMLSLLLLVAACGKKGDVNPPKQSLTAKTHITATG